MAHSLPESTLRTRLEALTPNQRFVLQALQQETQLISAQDLFAKLRQTEKIGLATIYRALETLKLAGFIQHQVTLSGESLYQTLEQDRHSPPAYSAANPFRSKAVPCKN